MLLIFGGELGKDRHGVGRTRLIHVDSLEAALERRILCQVLAELLRGGGTDDLEGAACEDRLEHGARVDGTLGRTGADQRVHFIDEQDDVVGLGGFGDHVLQALLKLAAVLGTGHQPGQVERPDILAHEVLGDVAGGDLLR